MKILGTHNIKKAIKNLCRL